MLHANFTALSLSFIEPELLSSEVLHCGKKVTSQFLQRVRIATDHFCLSVFPSVRPSVTFWYSDQTNEDTIV